MMEKVKTLIEQIKTLNKTKKGKFQNPIIPEIVFNLLFYVQQFRFSQSSDFYDITVLALLDIFIAYQMQETKNLELFQGIPKIYTLGLKKQPFLNFLAVANLGIQLFKNWGNNNFYFIFAVAWAIFFSTFSNSVTFSCILATIVMTFALNIWEDIKEKEHTGNSHMKNISPNVSSLEDNRAVAQDLVYKLKRLKFDMICDKEQFRLKRRLNYRRIRSKSETNIDSEDSTNIGTNIASTTNRQQDDNSVDNSLSVEDIRTLIQLLLAHNSQNMKYWIPREVQSVLNNEEVSAYLLAYLNTQDMLPSPRSFKNKNVGKFKSSLFSRISKIEHIGDDYNFNIFGLDIDLRHKDTMVLACSSIYQKFEVTDNIGTSKQTMQNFLKKVQGHYFNNYYHNFLHAADVTNSVAFFAKCGLKNLISDFELATLLISATVHDVGHPGFNNAFMMAMKTRQALIYNDQSVLENYHCSLTFQILQKHDCNITRHLTREGETAFRKILISAVLDTDLSKHFMIIKKFEAATNQVGDGEEFFDLEKDQNKFIVMGVALKCADVGHSSKSLELHKIWSRRISEEFWNQGDKEIDNDIPLTPLCDKSINLAKSQNGFLDFVAKPLFEAFGNFLKSDLYDKFCIQQLKENREFWSSELEREETDGSDALTFMKDTDKYVKNIKITNFNLDDFLITKKN